MSLSQHEILRSSLGYMFKISTCNILSLMKGLGEASEVDKQCFGKSNASNDLREGGVLCGCCR